jgi:hypothetical protein
MRRFDSDPRLQFFGNESVNEVALSVSLLCALRIRFGKVPRTSAHSSSGASLTLAAFFLPKKNAPLCSAGASSPSFPGNGLGGVR